jgi:outer membrane immunogenic protein
MKILIAAASAAVLAVLVPAAAQAQDAPTGVYGNLGYSNASAEDLNFGVLGGRLGYRMNNWLGVEGELGFGVKDETVNVAGVDVDLELKHTEAIYGVGFIPLGPNTDLLARIGYGNTELEGSAAGFSASEDGGSWNFGIGAQHHFDGVNGVRVDWTRSDFKNDGGKADTFSVAYTRKF